MRIVARVTGQLVPLTYQHVDSVRYLAFGVELQNLAEGPDKARVVALIPYANLLALEVPAHDSAILGGSLQV